MEIDQSSTGIEEQGLPILGDQSLIGHQIKLVHMRHNEIIGTATRRHFSPLQQRDLYANAARVQLFPISP